MKFENVDVLKNIASFHFLYVLNCIFLRFHVLCFLDFSRMFSVCFLILKIS